MSPRSLSLYLLHHLFYFPLIKILYLLLCIMISNLLLFYIIFYSPNSKSCICPWVVAACVVIIMLAIINTGSGIYVSTSRGTGTGLSIGAQPNNSYAIVNTGTDYLYYSSTRFSMMCCSNSSSSIGTYPNIILPNGYVRTSSYSSASITRYTGSSSLAGCISLSYSYSYRYSFYLSYPGIYTCSFGNGQFCSIGLYSEGTSSKF